MTASTFALPDHLRRPVEAAFPVDLSDVRVRTGIEADRANRCRGSLAFASDRDVVLSTDAIGGRAGAPDEIVAHELCHVVQKRLARVGTHGRVSVGRLEGEADAWAGAWRRGTAPPRPTPDPSPALRSFDYQEHYYTVYFVALVAGVPHEKAKKLAYFAQFPDEIIELDALKVVVKWARSECVDNPSVPTEIIDAAHDSRIIYSSPVTLYASLSMYLANTVYKQSDLYSFKIDTYHRRLCRRYGKVTGDAMMAIKTYCRTIQAGLHCLNDGPATAETNFRFAKLVAMDPDKQPMFFGLGLHALADSFAHRRIDLETRMYPPMVGHGRDALFGVRIRDYSVDYYGGHAADNIYVREPLYKAYGNALFRLFRYKYRDQPSLLPHDENVLDYKKTELSVLLSLACSSPDDVEQVRWLRRMIEAALGRPTHAPTGDERHRALERLAGTAMATRLADIRSAYAPRGEPIPFEEYHKAEYAKLYPVSATDLGDIVNLTKSWSHERR